MVKVRICGCPNAGSVQGKAGWGFKQPDMVEIVTAYDRGLERYDL